MTSTAAVERDAAMPDNSHSDVGAADDNWLLWCRLCAKEEDHLGNLSVFLGSTAIVGGSNKELSLTAAIQQYFGVNINHSEDLPKMLCAKCYSLVTLLVEFGNRVSRVQEMFRSLHNSNVRTKSDLHAARLKYGLVDGDHHPVLEQQSSPEVHYFDEKQQLNELEENGLQVDATVSNPLEIKKENTLQETQCMENDEENSSNGDHGHLPMVTLPSFQDQDSLRRNISCEMSTTDIEQETDTIQIIKASPLCRDRTEISKWQQELSFRGTKEPPKERKSRKNANADMRYFLRRDHFREHMEHVHSFNDNFDKFLCTKCPRFFTTQRQLQNHLKVHVPLKLKKVNPCPYCVKKFSSNFLVQSHIKYKHMKERPFICEICGKALHTITALNNHKLTHSDYAPFECEECKKRFIDKVRLKKHLEIHDPIKYTCPECGLQLNSRATLQHHSLVHSDEMQHKCDYCGRAFKRGKTLKNHLILHTGLKPYSCDFCPRTFANGSNFRTHKKKCHPEELASLEASGNVKRNTRNIPNLKTLKQVTKTSENLHPVASKQSGNFAFGKKKLSKMPIT